jgi:Domain of unknown function (DUF4259)
MGASSYLAFENDDAYDWLYELEDAEDNSILVNTFDAVLNAGDDYVQIPEASKAIAAAEVVAALLGREAMSLPTAVLKWIQGQNEVHLTVVEKARNAVNRVLANSEVQEAWQDSDDYSNWQVSVKDLMKRLA